MNATTIIQLAIAIFRLANWFAARVSQQEWKRMGYAEAAASQMREWQRSVGLADAAAATAAHATPEKRREVLGGDL